MWLAYNYDILRYAGRHWPLVVPYETWFGDALTAAKDLAQELDLVWQGSDHELETALSELINPEQRHHWADGGNAKLRCALALSEEVYRSILSLRNVSEANVSETLAMSLQSLLGAVQPFALEARESRTLKDDVQHLAAELKTVQSHLDEATAQIASQQERAERQRENEAILVARVDTLTRKMNEARAERDALKAEVARLAAAEAERAAAMPLPEDVAAREDLERQLSGARAEALRLEGERDGLRRDLVAAIAAREMAAKDFAEVSGRLEGFRKQLAAALSGREALEQTLAAAAESRAALERELAQTSPKGTGIARTGPDVVLARSVRTRAGIPEHQARRFPQQARACHRDA